MQLSKFSARQGATRPAARCQAAMERRSALLGVALVPALLAKPALALIPDEEDEEMVAKAKANRAKRLQQERETERAFIKEIGNAKVEGDLIPVQRAIVNIAKGGSQLEGGDTAGLADNLAGPWVADFEAAAAKVGASPAKVVAKIDSLKAAAASGDVQASKKQYIELSKALKDWVGAAKVAGAVSGL